MSLTFEDQVKSVIESHLEDRVFDAEIRIITSWQERGFIKDMRSAIIGCLFWKSMESVMRMGFIAEMEPLEMRALYDKLFIEFIQKADDKITERIEKAVDKPPKLAI